MFEEVAVHVIVAKIQMKPEFREKFLELMLDDARGSVENEPGCLQFSVVQDEKDPSQILLFEIYRDRAAFEAHMQMPHYLRWDNGVRDWYAAPIEVWQGPNLYPPDTAWKK
jgi:quinol monooxygenase YgiN